MVENKESPEHGTLKGPIEKPEELEIEMKIENEQVEGKRHVPKNECDVVSNVTIQTLYEWVYDACPCDKKLEYMFNGTLRCTKCNKDVLMTVPKFKVHYKVFDHSEKFSIIFFDHTATELLLGRLDPHPHLPLSVNFLGKAGG
ncbi:hypothetical protein K1719_005998 [Acacia pycnantha]|nr:hypothetical protein K1719_005998 [Acacia pycnantha]